MTEDRIMKKALIILAAAALSLISCNKETFDNAGEGATAPAAEIIFELTANHPDGAATKAVKTGWESGDVIFVFFNNVASPRYLKMNFDGSAWSTTQMNGAAEESLGLVEDATGTMQAVYLPFGNSLTVSSSGTAFTFSEVTYSYYLTATLDYTVVGGKVSGAFNMQIPEGYVQFFLDDASASPAVEIELREPHLTPQGIASIAADGTITHTTIAHGAPLKGYVYDKAVKETGESKGYLFSGILAEGARNTSTDYNFTLVSGGWEGSYYAKAFAGRTWYRGTSDGRALKMPALGSWTAVTDYKPIDLGCNVDGKRIYWCSRNLGATEDGPADSNTTYGDYYAFGETEPYYSSGAYDATPVWKDGKSAGYDYASYKYYDGVTWNDGSWTKYIGTDYSALQPEDDAAAQHASLGGNWRTPAEGEWTTLRDSNYYAWTWDGTNRGYVVTIKGGTAWTDPTLFLPATGKREGTGISSMRDAGFFLSASRAGVVYKCRNMFIELFGNAFMTDGERRYGYSVRPVSE